MPRAEESHHSPPDHVVGPSLPGPAIGVTHTFRHPYHPTSPSSPAQASTTSGRRTRRRPPCELLTRDGSPGPPAPVPPAYHCATQVRVHASVAGVPLRRPERVVA
jgi:hypothetical protein